MLFNAQSATEIIIISANLVACPACGSLNDNRNNIRKTGAGEGKKNQLSSLLGFENTSAVLLYRGKATITSDLMLAGACQQRVLDRVSQFQRSSGDRFETPGAHESVQP